MLWLAEHHFDGICAYVDPVSFAAALAASTRQIRIGFAVAQMSLHHPVRMAEQMALIDNISKGRLVVGLGRGTAYNIYDYQGYGIDPKEAYERLIEAEEIMIKAWTTENYEHKGKFWNLRMPLLRPRPYTKPHPFIIRACSGEEAMLGMARAGRPFLMNIQSNEITAQRMDLYRKTMRESGFDEAAIARNVDDTWVWRNIFVARNRCRGRAPGAAGVGNRSRNSGRPCARRSTRSRACCCTRKRAGRAQPGAALDPVRLARHRVRGDRRDRQHRRGRPDTGVSHRTDADRGRGSEHPALHEEGGAGVSQDPGSGVNVENTFQRRDASRKRVRFSTRI